MLKDYTQFTDEQLKEMATKAYAKQKEAYATLKSQVEAIIATTTTHQIENVRMSVDEEWLGNDEYTSRISMGIKLAGDRWSESFTMEYHTKNDGYLSISRGSSGSYTSEDKVQVATVIAIANIWTNEREIVEAFAETNLNEYARLQRKTSSIGWEINSRKRAAYEAEQKAKKETEMAKVVEGAVIEIRWNPECSSVSSPQDCETPIRIYVVTKVNAKTITVQETTTSGGNWGTHRWTKENFMKKVQEIWNSRRYIITWRE